MNLAHFRTLALVLAVAWPIAGPSALRAATILVTTNLDSGIGSFRDAIDLANATAGTDDIVFNLVNLVNLAAQKQGSVQFSATGTGTKTSRLYVHSPAPGKNPLPQPDRMSQLAPKQTTMGNFMCER